MTEQSVEVVSKGTSRTVVGGDGGPWWVKYTMQAGFLAVLILVLWGVYDLMKTKLPTLAEPVSKIAELAKDGERHLERQAIASEKQADAAARQAAAIERWVNFQSYGPRLTAFPEPVPVLTP